MSDTINYKNQPVGGMEGQINNKNIILIILDGWGLSPSWSGNAILMNKPPNITSYWREYPHLILQAVDSFKDENIKMSDSRLGHTLISAGRPILQDIEIINKAIKNNSFYKNRVLLECFDYARRKNTNIHFVGLVSDGGTHSHINHLLALLEMAHRQKFSRIFIDAILDGVDTDEESALKYLDLIARKIRENNLGVISSLIGRKYAMNNSGEFKNTKKVFDLIINGHGNSSSSIQNAIAENYRRGLNDSGFEPTLIKSNGNVTTIKQGDVVIFFNFRPDRMTQLLQLLTGSYSKIFFKPKLPKDVMYVTFTKYLETLNLPVVFSRDSMTDILPSVFAKYQKANLRIAEKVKESHVTKYFNGGREEEFGSEERQIVPSKNVKSYDQVPEMSAKEICEKTILAVDSRKYPFILINFANCDTVAHTANIIAAGQAVLSVDYYTGQIVQHVLKNNDICLITADHGNVEEIIRGRKNIHQNTVHTGNPVPFILISNDLKRNLLQGAVSAPFSTLSKIVSVRHSLTDIAPTILELMNLPKPEVMTGHSLLKYLE